MTTPTVSILIVSYNTRNMILEAIRSARDQTRTPHEIIVVDNASTDGSPEAIAERFPDLRLMAEAENHGFARANNLAAREARGRFLLLLNPDTVVLDGAIDRLVSFALSRPDARIWGGRTLFADHSLNPASCWAAMSLRSLFYQATGLDSLFRQSGLFNLESYGGWRRDTERGVDIVAGCFLLIERAFWERLGGFDLTYFMYGEEADLCLRARALGARPRITPDAQIIHYAGASETVRADKMVRLLRAKATLIRRHFPSRRRKMGLILLRAWPWSRMLAFGLLVRLSGAERHRVKYETWREVWVRRAEWREGYPDFASESGSPPM